MNLNNIQIGFAGYVPSSLISFMHLQDVAVAFLLGFIGSMGAFLFKYIVERLKK